MDLDRVVDYLRNVVGVQARNNGLKPEVIFAPDYRYTFRKDRNLVQSELTYDQIRMIGQLELGVRLLEMMKDVEENLPYEAFLQEVRDTLNQMRDIETEDAVANIMSNTGQLMAATRGYNKHQEVIRLCAMTAANSLQIRNKTIGIKRQNVHSEGKLEVV